MTFDFCISFSLFMAPRDSGIGTELDLELDEGSYEEEEEGNMDEERWGTANCTIIFCYHFSRKYWITSTHTVALSSLKFDSQMTAKKPCGSSVFASKGPEVTLQSNYRQYYSDITSPTSSGLFHWNQWWIDGSFHRYGALCAWWSPRPCPLKPAISCLSFYAC